MNQERQHIYIKANRSVEVKESDVRLSDIASVYCMDHTICATVKNLKIHHFEKDKSKRCIISIMEIIAMIQAMYPMADINIVGETDTIIKRIDAKDSKLRRMGKILLVSLICFFGASFTIMAFHNDVGIIRVFSRIYLMLMGRESDGFGVLEVSYSLGLAVGIIVFFNHIGKRRITKDPTPIEVEMKIYEEEVEKTLVDLAQKEHMEIELS